MPPIDRFISPGANGYERLGLGHPRFKPDDFVTTRGTRPGACFRVLECLGVDADNSHRWYMIQIGTARVRICESDLRLVEVIEELGRIVDV